MTNKSSTAQGSKPQEAANLGAPTASAMKVALVNQKGGVGKTTSAVNLAAGLAERGARVGLFDLDPQGSASAYAPSLQERFGVVSQRLTMPNVTLPSVRKAIDHLENSGCTVILIDCPPTLGKQISAALSCANIALVPVNSEYEAMKGFKELLASIEAAKNSGNHFLSFRILFTMFDTRAGHCHELVNSTRRLFGSQCLQTVIPRSYDVANASRSQESLVAIFPESKVGAAYKALASEWITLFPSIIPNAAPDSSLLNSHSFMGDESSEVFS